MVTVTDNYSLVSICQLLAESGRQLEARDRPGAHRDPSFRDAEQQWWTLVQATSTAPALDLAGAAVQIAAAFQLITELVEALAPDEQTRLTERRRRIDRLLMSALGVLERDAVEKGGDLEAVGLTAWLRAAHCDPWSHAYRVV